METRADGVKLQLPGAPQSRQDGSTQGQGQGDLDRGGSVTQICGTTLETAGVTSAHDAAGQRLPTQVWVQAAADVQGEGPCSIELWEDWKHKKGKKWMWKLKEVNLNAPVHIESSMQTFTL